MFYNTTLCTVVTLILVACATPTKQTEATMVVYDKDTEYAITPLPDGFYVAINYSRYQFIPESDALGNSAQIGLICA